MKFSIEETSILNFTLTTEKKNAYLAKLSAIKTDDLKLRLMLEELSAKIEELNDLEFTTVAIDRQLMKLTTFPLYECPLIKVKLDEDGNMVRADR